MKGNKKLLIVLVGVLLVIAAAVAFVLVNYHVVGFHLYEKDAAVLDLRQQEISVEDYEKLDAKTDAGILWNVPFQGGTVAHDATEITITSLTEEDVLVLDHLKQLKTVNAETCTDYAALAALRQRRPEVEVDYSVHFSGDSYRWDMEEVVLSSVAEEDIHLLEHMPNLQTVAVSGGGHDAQVLKKLQTAAKNMGLEFGVVVNGKLYLDTEKEVTLEGITDEELELLPCLTDMETLHIVDPAASAENIAALPEKLSGVQVTWEVSIAGQRVESTAVEVDLSAVTVKDLAEVEAQMAYLPNAETLILGLCGMDNTEWGNSKSKLAASAIENEDLSAYRDRVRDSYKVVWTVRLGPNIALRTDADNFMPNHFGVGQLPDSYAYNLRYCEDMVCLDVGHMTLTDISFVEYMPKLKYLILAWTEVQYIEPIRTCKNLIWLELDNSCIRDYSPLVGCTALQDLNIGNTFCDITPILEMTWLNNLYMIRGSGGAAWKASQALPNTRVVTAGDATVGGGWRRLQNYYDMRDCLGMYYMN